MHTSRGLGRLVGFADGVVAIAITLLILPLVDSASGMKGDVWGFIQDNGFQLMVFVISFLVIGRFWVVHHAMYENVIDYNRGLLWWNLLWLLTIAFLPFPTELLAADSSGQPLTHGLYIGTMALTTVTSTVQQYIIVRHPELQADAVRGTLTLLPSLVAMITLIVATIIAVVFPAVGLFALLLLIVTGRIGAAVQKRNASRSRTTTGQ